MSVQFDSVDDILNNAEYTNEFQIFLRNHLALENLLFYQGVDLYCTLELQRNRQVGGKFLINQFVKEDSEDSINIPYIMRKDLVELDVYQRNSFEDAQFEVKKLMEMNYLLSFQKHYNKSNEPEILNIAPEVSYDSFGELSMGDIELLVSTGKTRSGKFSVKSCGCKKKPEGLTYCCERSRAMNKLKKIVKKMKASKPKIRRRSFLGFANSSSLLKKKKKAVSKVDKKLCLKDFYNQPNCATKYAAFKGCRVDRAKQRLKQRLNQKAK